MGVFYGVLGVMVFSVDMYLIKNGFLIDEDLEFDYVYCFIVVEGDLVVVFYCNCELCFYGFIGFNCGDYLINGDIINFKMCFKE